MDITDGRISGLIRAFWGLLKAQVPLNKNWRILDFGCGGGELMALIAAEGFDVKGVEINEASIKRCHELSRHLNMELDVMRPGDFKPNQGRYDLLIMRDVVEHLDDVSVLNQLLEIVPRVLIATPNRFSIPLFFRDPHNGLPFFSILSRSMLERINGFRGIKSGKTVQFDPGINYVNAELYSTFRLSSVLRQNGFRIRRSQAFSYYASRDDRRLLTVIGKCLPGFIFDNFVSPEIVIYGEK